MIKEEDDDDNDDYVKLLGPIFKKILGKILSLA